jgi:hypothetical protein
MPGEARGGEVEVTGSGARQGLPVGTRGDAQGLQVE